jgi:hypothetical protein
MREERGMTFCIRRKQPPQHRAIDGTHFQDLDAADTRRRDLREPWLWEVLPVVDAAAKDDAAQPRQRPFRSHDARVVASLFVLASDPLLPPRRPW